MDDTFTVYVAESANNLKHILGSLLFREFTSASKFSIQFTFTSIFQDEIDAGGIMEISIKFEDIGMTEMGLNFDLTSNLFIDESLSEFQLGNNFESNDKASRFFPSQIDTPKLSFA